MSIRTRQISRQTEKAIRKELLAGRFPELTAIQNQVSNYFNDKSAGLPRFEPKDFTGGNVSAPSIYNTMLQQIYEDFETSFEEVDYQYNKLLAQEELNEKEKQRILLFLKEIERKSIRIEQLLRYRKAHSVFTENFFDFSQIEFDPQEDKNIAGTTAFIDLRQNKANLHQSQIGREKIYLGEADVDVNVYTENVKTKTLGRAENATKDTINSSWRMVVTHDTPTETKVGFVVGLPQSEKLSKIKLSIQSKNAIDVQLLLSEDGEQWTEQETYTINNQAEWSFSPKQASFIQFMMTKQNYDDINGVNYEYWFGIQNITAYRESFVDSAVITSKPFSINEPYIDTILLTAREEKHPSTNIRYFIGEEIESEPIEWNEVRPNEPFEMNMLELKEERYLPGPPPYETMISDVNFPHKQFYEIGWTEYDPIPERTELRQGERMWKVSHYNSAIPESTIPSLADWVGDVRSYKEFLYVDDTLRYDWITILGEAYSRFDICFETTDIVSWASKQISYKGDVRLQIYVNNMLIQPTKVNTENGITTNTYSFYFRPGKQKITMAFVGFNLGGYVSFNFDFADSGIREVFAEEHGMKYVPWNEFVRYTSSNDTTKFTIVGNKIIVPYKPSERDYKRWMTFEDVIYGIDFSLRYRYIEEKRDNISLRVMAMLERDEKMREVSPFLLEYSLIVQ